MKKQKILLSFLGWLFLISFAVGQQGLKNVQPYNGKVFTLEEIQSQRKSLQSKMGSTTPDHKKKIQQKLAFLDEQEAKVLEVHNFVEPSLRDGYQAEDLEARRDREIIQQMLDYARTTDRQQKKQLERVSVAEKMKLHYSQKVSKETNDRTNASFNLEKQKQDLKAKMDASQTEDERLGYEALLNKINNQ